MARKGPLVACRDVVQLPDKNKQAHEERRTNRHQEFTFFSKSIISLFNDISIEQNTMNSLGWVKTEVTTDVCTPDFLEILKEVSREDCKHSWSGIELTGSMDDCRFIEERENHLRPTAFFLYWGCLSDGRKELFAVATIASHARNDFEEEGFPVLGRCYIRKKYRGLGLYRPLFFQRVNTCMNFWKSSLKGIHVGAGNFAVQKVLENSRSTDFQVIELGLEEITTGFKTELVKDYLIITPQFSQKLVDEVIKVQDHRMQNVSVKNLVEQILVFVREGFGSQGYSQTLQRLDLLRRQHGLDLRLTCKSLDHLLELMNCIGVLCAPSTAATGKYFFKDSEAA